MSKPTKSRPAAGRARTAPPAKPSTRTGRTLPISALRPDPANPRVIDDAALAGLSVSEREYGDLACVVFNTRTAHLVAGHQRVRTLTDAGAVEVVRTSGPAVGAGEGYIDDPRTGERFRVRFVDWTEQRERAANIVANSPEIAGRFTPAALPQLAELRVTLAEFPALRLDVLETTLTAQFAADADAAGSAGEDAAGGGGAGSLAARFLVPPFSVLDARQGYWQDRKRAWLALGIESEIGRGGGQAHERDDSADRPDRRPVGDTGARAGGEGGPMRRGYARAFGQDLMRGEHVVAGRGRAR